MQIENKMFLGDCLEVLKEFPDKSIDLVCSDPPYIYDKGLTEGFGKKRAYLRDIYNQGIINGISNDLLNELRRVCKIFNAYFFCNKAQIKQYLDFAYDNHFSFDILKWCKTNPPPMFNGGYLKDTEYIIFLREKGAYFKTNYHDAKTYWVEPVYKNKFDHPTVKPLYLMERMINNSSKEGDIVLDCFGGTGSTAVATKKLNRKFVYIENNKKYYDIAESRILIREEKTEQATLC